MNTEKQEEVKENGQVTLRENGSHIHLLSIIGEIEGHECAPASAKTTKYEHVLPQLAAIEDDLDIEGLLILINTVGGDISAGLALAEMIASLSCPTVSRAGRQPFHRRAPGGIHRLFPLLAHRHHDHPSRAHDRHGHRGTPDI